MGSNLALPAIFQIEKKDKVHYQKYIELNTELLKLLRKEYHLK